MSFDRIIRAHPAVVDIAIDYSTLEYDRYRVKLRCGCWMETALRYVSTTEGKIALLNDQINEHIVSGCRNRFQEQAVNGYAGEGRYERRTGYRDVYEDFALPKNFRLMDRELDAKALAVIAASTALQVPESFSIPGDIVDGKPGPRSTVKAPEPEPRNEMAKRIAALDFDDD